MDANDNDFENINPDEVNDPVDAVPLDVDPINANPPPPPPNPPPPPPPDGVVPVNYLPQFLALFQQLTDQQKLVTESLQAITNPKPAIPSPPIFSWDLPKDGKSPPTTFRDAKTAWRLSFSQWATAAKIPEAEWMTHVPNCVKGHAAALLNNYQTTQQRVPTWEEFMILLDAASIGVTCKGFELMQLLYKFRFIDAIENPITDTTFTKAINEYEALLHRAEGLTEYQKCSLIYNALPNTINHLFRYENVDGIGARVEHKELRTMKLRIFEQCGTIVEELKKLKASMSNANTSNANTSTPNTSNTSNTSQKRKADHGGQNSAPPNQGASGSKDSGYKGQGNKDSYKGRLTQAAKGKPANGYRSLSNVPKEQRTASKTRKDDLYYMRGMPFEERKARDAKGQCITCDQFHPTDTCEKRFELFDKGDFFYYPRTE